MRLEECNNLGESMGFSVSNSCTSNTNTQTQVRTPFVSQVSDGQGAVPTNADIKTPFGFFA